MSANCPKTSKSVRPRRKYHWCVWLFPFVGLASLAWFLIRVIPKPSRASYPCQRVAAPLASGFVIWLTGVIGSILFFHKAKRLLAQSRYVLAYAAVMLALVAGYLAISATPDRPALAFKTPDPVNDPIGTAKGIFPGRVVWIYDPDATDWDGTTGFWSDSGNTDSAVVDDMMSKSLRGLTGQPTDAGAWNALFRHYNQNNGKGDVGYDPSEKITIKLNLTVTNADSGSAWTDASGNMTANVQYVSHSPEMVYSLLDQLVNQAGVPEANIYIGDPTCRMYNQLYTYLVVDFPNVNYLDGCAADPTTDPSTWTALPGRVAVDFSSTELVFSGPGGSAVAADHLPQSYADAEYFINFSIFKAHAAAITLSGKNHYGSLIRRPHGHSYWYDIHPSLPLPGSPAEAMGQYRALVDLMGHDGIGGKTMLYIVDGLWGGYGWGGICPPQKWRSEPFVSNNGWPSSIMVSQDPVAIDSVGFDFWWEEDNASWNYFPFATQYWYGHYPHLDGGDDYLHEAAEADNPTSGTYYDPEDDGTRMASLGVHEHWNNTTDKEYSRNLGTGLGIELFTAGDILPTVTILATDADAGEQGPETGTFTITRDGSSGNLMVAYSVGGTAESNDYSPLTGAVIIPAGQTFATVTILPIDDDPYEGDETVVLTITANAAYMVGSPASDTVTITDNDVVGDFDGSGALEAEDLQMLYDARDGTDMTYDLDDDQIVDYDDVDVWVLDLYGTVYGDFNLDYLIDTSDASILMSNWNDFSGDATLLTGDATKDGCVDTSDAGVLMSIWPTP